ncbi:hypothetical protein [Dokdonella sp.]|uniref:hypothetical protein n=1 Tax=Dokdonella sp. TaxID=2291710 RepID=UPI003C36B028
MAGTPSAELVALSADFNDKTPGQAIGIGGAAVGEPNSLGQLDTLIVETSPGENFLRVDNDMTSTNARTLRWGFEDDAEFGEGMVSVSLDFTPSAQSNYNLFFREQGGAARNFMTATFGKTGDLGVRDQAGTIGTYSDFYVGGDTLHNEMLFDMDARTSSLVIDDVTLFTGRQHGIGDRGVGAFYTGYYNTNDQTGNGEPFDIDNLMVLAEGPMPLVFDTDFNSQTSGQQIGTGGAALGEPVLVPPQISAKNVQIGASNVALQLENTTPATSRLVHWEFLEGIQIRTGIVVVEMDLLFVDYERYVIRVGEQSGAASVFGTVYFFPDPMSTTSGNVVIGDAGGSSGVVGTYQANVFQRLQMIYDMDEATYTVKLNGAVLVEDRPHSVTTGLGIGSLDIGFQANGLTTIPYLVDNLQVGASKAPVIPAVVEFLQEPTQGDVNDPMYPEAEVAVGNVYADLVPDGTLVSMVIESGPAGAVLSGAIEPVSNGVAQFNNLSVDLPGTYRLRALSGDAEQSGSMDVVIIDPSDWLFEDGFDGDPMGPD